MRRDSITRAAGALLAATCFAAAVAGAQSPAVNPQEGDYAKQQQARQVSQPLNNQPVWKEIRSGLPQVTTVQGRETNVLIQPQGQTWRALRVPVATAGGLLVALAVLGLGLFYAVRGPITYDAKPGDRQIERFTLADRVAHWLTAIIWVLHAVTGLVLSIGKALILPLIGYTLFSWLADISKDLHNFLGPVLVVVYPWLVIRFIRNNGISGEDVKWFANIVGYFKGHEYPSGKFNAGEKVVFWLIVVLLTTILSVTGMILLFPNFDQTRQTMQIANIVHMVAAYAATALACVHIYLGTIGTPGTYRGMRDGYVDASWAEHHHARWYAEVVAGTAREKFVQPAAAAPADVAARRPGLGTTPTEIET